MKNTSQDLQVFKLDHQVITYPWRAGARPQRWPVSHGPDGTAALNIRRPTGIHTDVDELVFYPVEEPGDFPHLFPRTAHRAG